MKIEAYCWFRNASLDEWMHAADVFGTYKVLAPITPTRLSIEWKPGHGPMDIPIEKRVEHLRPLGLLAIWAPNVEGFAWRDRSVWEISSGHECCMFSDLLRHLGWDDPPPPYPIGGAEYNQEILARKWLREPWATSRSNSPRCKDRPRGCAGGR